MSRKTEPWRLGYRSTGINNMVLFQQLCASELHVDSHSHVCLPTRHGIKGASDHIRLLHVGFSTAKEASSQLDIPVIAKNQQMKSYERAYTIHKPWQKHDWHMKTPVIGYLVDSHNIMHVHYRSWSLEKMIPHLPPVWQGALIKEHISIWQNCHVTCEKFVA